MMDDRQLDLFARPPDILGSTTIGGVDLWYDFKKWAIRFSVLNGHDA